MKQTTTVFLLAFVITQSAFGIKYIGNGGTGKKSAVTPGVLAGCSPATSRKDLDINNTKAMIHSGGDMWWDLVGAARYEIPKGSGKMALFAGALWLGGRDVSGQLKVAAQRFRDNGNDFWTGPLNTITAEIDPQTCIDWDKHYVTTRDEVSRFKAYFDAGLDDATNGTTTQLDNFPNYQIPQSIINWPAHGRNSEPYNEDFYLAPFFDRNLDGVFDPYGGDYPWYDFSAQPSCTQGKINKIYGDQNIWWIFNDKGNAHTQTGSASIGLEVRAQAFAFATSDEINNMTFYNYELVNRSTYTLTETYFGQWVDPDMGNYKDDYVGCDVQRGLGYCYNGDEMDEDYSGALGYGSQPPAIGVDFFQGPFQDNDEQDNPGPLNNIEILTYQNAFNNDGIPYKGIGIGYGDGEPDNERFGMRKFLYFNNAAGPNGDPETGADYYNYLRGYWKDGKRMTYGADGRNGTIAADYMFPDNTDPIGWGTQGNVQPAWTEVTAGNTPDDRRFVQSAGPFTLLPGATNNITVGVVWAQAVTGGRLASVELLRKADDKTQSMFDNCFSILNGPDAPELSFRELDKELIIYISNKSISNNYLENYSETDHFLSVPGSVDFNNDGVNDYTLTNTERDEFNKYRFQGYLVYQVKDNAVSPSDLKNPEKARLIFQCDIKDGVKKIINNVYNSEIDADVPTLEVTGEDKGISHSFKITDDEFAVGDKKLVNHKKVYFLAVAYGYNYSKYNAYLLPIEQQKKPYIQSRKAATGGIKVFAAIPHKTDMDFGGTIANSTFGDEMELTRLEGQGNGGRTILMTKESMEEAVANGRVKNIVYQKGKAPVSIKIIDPLNVPKSDFHFEFLDSITSSELTDKANPIDSAGYWWYVWENGKYQDGKLSDKAIMIENEELLLDWGISINTKQVSYPRYFATAPKEYEDDILAGSITHEDPSKPWFSGIPDEEGYSHANWIRSGTSKPVDDAITPIDESLFDDRYYLNTDNNPATEEFIDESQVFEKILGGTWAPFLMAAQEPDGPAPASSIFNDGGSIDQEKSSGLFKLKYLQSVDIVITSDKSKWTRCPVLEMQNEPTLSAGIIVDSFPKYPVPLITPTKKSKGYLRSALSVDKNGVPYDTTGLAFPFDSILYHTEVKSNNPEAANFISPLGMGWFPGYAVNVETGERLNMAFGEDSWLGAENGKDMKWNPTTNILEPPYIPGVIENWRLGGKHYIFVFRNNVVEDATAIFYPKDRMPAYDFGKFIFETLSAAPRDVDNFFKNVYRAAMWVGLPLLAEGRTLLETDVTVALRVARPFENYGTGLFLSKGNKLTVGTLYFVDKGPVIHAGTTYVHGQSFKAINDSFNIDALNIQNGDTLNNLVYNTDVNSANGGRPIYSFSTREYATDTNQSDIMEDALSLINVVPNPYYAYSEYETDKVDNRIKIINLPRKCNISIYTTNGTLVRKFTKDDPTISSVDWDLKNNVRIPIASGVYIIHVEVPDVGERILKWMGIMRPVDLDSF